MFPQTGAAAPTSRFSVEIRRFPWIKRLAVDYAFDYARVAEFFAGNPADPAAWRDAIARTQRHPRDRDAIADLVVAQQRRRGAPPDALAAAARLRDPSSVAVVTGQQAGLFGGPLFTLLKAVTAIRLAERTAADYRVPTVAVFWIDAEDHDWNEVHACGVLNTDCGLSLAWSRSITATFIVSRPESLPEKQRENVNRSVATIMRGGKRSLATLS